MVVVRDAASAVLEQAEYHLRGESRHRVVGEPEISADNKQITVHLRKGIKFSPPVNREVTSADVAYAFQRATNPNVANPYYGAYFKSIEGEPEAEKAAARNRSRG